METIYLIPIMIISRFVSHFLTCLSAAYSRQAYYKAARHRACFSHFSLALPFAPGAFPHRQAVLATHLAKQFWDKGEEGGLVEIKRGI